MDIEFSQIDEMVYMHDIVNSDSKKKPRIPLKKFLNAEKVLTQTISWALNSRFVNVNSVNKVNVKSKVKSSYISRSVNDEFSLTDDEINSFKETLVLSSIDSLSKLVLNNPLSVLFTSTVRRNNNRAKMNVEFDSWICTRCC
ncbi:TPA: hypothetical protein KMM14_000536 [Escherichia coli]|uniref:protein YqeK n=1 Tax=Escherichia coli TaxID=562 RepID=UPI000BF8482D|nr:protein YqeK [Escherichia coli]EFB2564576.1 hypothetical protein [Escherichia coli]MBS8828555.1 hypothetical protein [Escherichia coli]MBS8837470.1 hypothetical protein [Escherichia coli]MBS8921248.1 hypothetical protein [Escherichia coli]MCV5844315.1 hypothetical protein [Escherichia coli]